MRWKFWLGTGFALGYYFGTKAGRERYHQIEDLLDKVRDHPLITKAVDSAKDLAGDARDLARDAIDSRVAGATPTAPGSADDTAEHQLFSDPTFN